ncbi:hypothetical protein GCM10027195_42190 [Comamonas sediminis]
MRLGCWGWTRNQWFWAWNTFSWGREEQARERVTERDGAFGLLGICLYRMPQEACGNGRLPTQGKCRACGPAAA